jgi:2-methylcitrate dehydratase PrpD
MTSSTGSTAVAQPPITRDLATAIAAFALSDLPDAVLHEAKRSLFNVLAVAIGASMHPGVDAILRVSRETGGTPVAPIVGRSVLANAHFAALANGFAAHVDDYDDTHLATVIHPAAAIAATLLALAPAAQPTGEAAMRAFVLGCEIQLRLGVAISPEHYDDGWHITGTCGTIGAAVAAAALLGLDARATARAIGIAASSTVGQREAFGRMTKAYHAGKAAASGIRAAALAKRGFTAPEDALEAPGGFADALATTHRITSLDLDLHAGFELAKNTYKPYPCGIVAHPSIDAAVALAARIGSPGSVAAVVVHCNPLVPELMGNLTPADGLQARFSAVHGVTMGLRDGTVGLAQYDDAIVVADDVAALRARVKLEPDEAMPRASARVSVRLNDGTVVEETVTHARGSLERPLTDAELNAKALALVEPVLPGRIGALRSAVSELTKAPDVAALIAAVTP